MTRPTAALDLGETVVSTAVGLLVSWALTYGALPLWGFAPDPRAAAEITAMFTAASMVRQYAVRRVFRHIDGGRG